MAALRGDATGSLKVWRAINGCGARRILRGRPTLHWCGVVLLVVGCQIAAAPLSLLTAPIVPEITDAMHQELLQQHSFGLRRGMRPGVFSLVGDSISSNKYFLKPLAHGAQDLGDYASLEPVLEFYRGTTVRSVEGVAFNSFDIDGIGALSGWKAEHVVEPGSRFWDPLCVPRETPLQCELRIARPEITLIMIGTNDVGVTSPAVYADQLLHIVRRVQSYGSIAVLSTLPAQRAADGVDAAEPYNQIIVDVAARRHAPLWNFWRALEALPSQGVEPGDIHPNVPPNERSADFSSAGLRYGMNVRNLTALQVLAELHEILHAPAALH